MSQFLYLYRGGRTTPPSPDEAQRIMQKWMTWLKGLGESGNLKDQGQPLEPRGKVVKGKAKTITDAPFAEAKDLVGGFTVVEARDINEAAELSKGCPILEEDGTVEVRPIMIMSM